ncbi:glycine cleavage system protein GcvH [Ruficoccus amylovorans]|uniref:Glycine cleavage system H protein n=1 Tax=Ruficoccus amylovorans TaxID=1804625 RepID=A0A842HKR2_9BACT|nr:glycine cleavage system protein GcvH [Ruficoccus amylovorans]MBC2596116.1 glycine cleavage system protein GcvH [Ruficoccus amylovorans]
MSDIPSELKYTEDHEWILVQEDGTALIGITDHAQESLGDITFVDLPQAGDSFAQGETFGAVESVKAASDLYMPVSGEIIESNPDLDAAPESVNNDPYGAAWMIKVKVSDPSELDKLLNAAAYEAIL